MYEPLPHFYENVVQNQVRHVYWSGTITADGVTYNFGANQIVANTGKIINEISGSKMEIGTTYSSELDIQLYIDDIGVPRDKIYGAKITLQCVLSANGVQAPCPMGVFNVVEATQKGSICSIVAYDNMILFDKEFEIYFSLKTPYDWLRMICYGCGVTLGMTKSQVENLPNGDFWLTLWWTEEESHTFRDVLGQLTSAMGCSAHMNRNGQLVVLPLTDNPSVATLRANDRFGSDIAHNEWTPAMFCVLNSTTGELHTAGSGQLAFDLGENTFLQGNGIKYTLTENGGYERKNFPCEDLLQNILDSASSLSVVPVKADIPLDPCLDLFDLVTLTGGQADDTKILITSMTHTIGGGTEINCAGENITEEVITSRGTVREMKDEVWVQGWLNEEAVQAETGTQSWGQVRHISWGDIKQYTWENLLSGDGEEFLVSFSRKFTEEFTFGVVGLTTRYTTTNDAEVTFKIRIYRWMGGETWNLHLHWQSTEHALRGDNVCTLVLPFVIQDRDGSRYRFEAWVSGVDVVEEATYLTKEEILELLGGS